MRALATAAASVLLVLTTTAAAAQELPSNARTMIREFARSGDNLDLDGATGPDVVSTYVRQRIQQLAAPRRVGITDLRTDVEAGSLAATGGASLLARSSVTDLLSAAFESGAVVRKADDKAVTLTFNALPVQQLMAGDRPIGCGATDRTCEFGLGRWLRGLSGSVTFSTSNPVRPADGTIDGETLAFLVGGRKVQGYAARYELFVRERRHDRQQAELDKAAVALSGKLEELLDQESQLQTRLDALLAPAGGAEGTDWYARTQADLRAAVAARPGASPEALAPVLEAVLLDRLERAFELARPIPEVTDLVAKVGPERDTYIRAMNMLLAEKLHRKAVTVDYASVRPTDQPVFHQVKAVVSMPLGGTPATVMERKDAVPSGTVTANAGVSWFKPGVDGSDAWQVRDSQVSVGFDWSPPAWGTKRPIYTAAYYFQYMHQNGVLQFNGEAVTPGGAMIPLSGSAKTVLNTKGAIHVVQFRVSIPAGSGVKFPAALSWANRTELITGRPFWQGHVGVSYDFAALKELLRKD